jgi:hypothetical protein
MVSGFDSNNTMGISKDEENESTKLLQKNYIIKQTTKMSK